MINLINLVVAYVGRELLSRRLQRRISRRKLLPVTQIEHLEHLENLY
jgi:hypothetical protein